MTNVNRTLNEVDAEIAKVQEELNNVTGTQTEVYARIVGYYRAVRNWNKGKADEFKHRKMFTLEDSNRYDITDADKPCACSKMTKISNTQEKVLSSEIASYDIFVRKTCPNCPPVKEYMANVNVQGNAVDVDTPEGLSLAASKGVFAAPTVIVYDSNNTEIARAHNVEELTSIFEKQVVLA